MTFCGMLWLLFSEGLFVVQESLSGEDSVHTLRTLIALQYFHHLQF